ncbi:MAG: hypothetical protein ABSB09_07005 [Acidimicrobiales bacterium]|jgi:hypothetical protein
MEGVRDAVASGTIDERSVGAARTTARMVVRGRPPPSGGTGWTDDEIADLVADMVVRVGLDKVVLAAEKAANDAQFVGWLRTALTSQLEMAARSTASGRVLRSVEDALREDPDQFRLSNGHWGLVDDDREPGWTEGIGPLVAVAHTVPTRAVRISTASRKTPPMAYRPDIRKIATEVLSVAGPLAKDQLAEVVCARFVGSFSEVLGYLDEHELDVTLGGDDEAELTDGVLAARWMLTQLTADERAGLAAFLATGGIRGMADQLGGTKYQSEVLYARIEEKLKMLQDLAGADEAAVSHLLALVGQSEQLRHSYEDGRDGN